MEERVEQIPYIVTTVKYKMFGTENDREYFKLFTSSADKSVVEILVKANELKNDQNDELIYVSIEVEDGHIE